MLLRFFFEAVRIEDRWRTKNASLCVEYVRSVVGAVCLYVQNIT